MSNTSKKAKPSVRTVSHGRISGLAKEAVTKHIRGTDRPKGTRTIVYLDRIEIVHFE